MTTRKTPEQIKEEILSCLNDGPLSTEQIRIKVESNWSTINNYLEELNKEGKVKEIISGDNAKIYQKIFGDTYFEIPITEKERKRFRTLFSMIIKKYKDINKIPNKTELAKTAVEVINSPESGLSDLPIIWYLYGAIPLMIADPSKEYSEETEFENKNKINNTIEFYIKRNDGKMMKQLEKEQHTRYNEELYVLSDEFFEVLNKREWKNEEILKILNKFFIACPVDLEFPDIFSLTNKVISLIEKLALVGVELQTHRKEILLSFDSLWKFIALYKLYISKTTGPNAMKKEDLLRYYIGTPLEARKNILQESILELNSIYLQNLSKFDSSKIKLSKEVMDIRKIMESWTGED